MRRVNWYVIGGATLVAWAVTNSFVVIQRYGVGWGTYFWFCNLCLLGTGVGLLFKSRGLLTGFVAIASFTQAFWLIDNVVRRFAGRGYFGLVDFRYDSGYPVDEFILASYHYFTIPIALWALLNLPQRKNQTLRWVMIFNPLIFGISYFAFPSSQNINCIHEACFGGLKQWHGPLYALCFWAIVFAIHLVVSHELNRWLLSIRVTERLKRNMGKAFATACVLGVTISVSDAREKLTVPRLTCLEPQTVGDITSGCQFTKNFYNDRVLLGYYVDNQTAEDKLCSVTLDDGVVQLVLNESMTASAKDRAVFSTPVPRPKQSTAIKIVTSCQPFISSASTN